ncbi:MAG: peptidoglycan editing factor PgeF [Gammaproteobacteria bacterium]|nr:peptidoglycan editing factor PgeF [Gammaproteobacteria bacterium]MYE28200.1 peptidoglycan editing factor PgeF [Gammaproteobacteria bacterium]
MRASELLRPDWPAPDTVLAAVTTRNGGCSEGEFAGLNMALHVGDAESSVRRNRKLAADAFAPDAQFQWLRQVHGSEPAIVFQSGEAPEADSLISSAPGIALCVLTADCLPIFVCNRAGDEVGIIHAGWRGMSAGIIENTLAAMCSEPEDLLIWLGPAIQSCHYEVGEDVREAFLDCAADTREQQQFKAAFAPLKKQGKYYADLPQIARIKLHRLGAASISGGIHCTYSDASRFYSHRRDGLCGRMANLICINPA